MCGIIMADLSMSWRPKRRLKARRSSMVEPLAAARAYLATP